MNRELSTPVLITGASSGIGRALAEEYLRRDIPVIATARKIEAIRDLEGPQCLIARLDVTDEASIISVHDQSHAWKGPVGVLINNAGWGLMGPVLEIDPEAFRAQMETNLIGVSRMIRVFAPEMIRKRQGLIVNIGSVSGLTATPFAGAYCASKAALHSLSDALRMEVAPFGIHVVTVQAGAVSSSFGSTATSQVALSEGSPYAPFLDRIIKRAGASQEIAMPTGEFARIVVGKLLKQRPPAIIRLGPFSRKLVLLGRLPIPLRDRILRRMSGLDHDRE